MTAARPAAQATSLRLDDQVCFALYAASRAITGRYRSILEDLGLTYPQYLVLLVLWERGAVPVKELGTALHLDYGTLSPLLKRLEASGLVGRQRRVDDERSVEITLTESGKALRERAKGVPAKICDATGFDPAELAELRDTLHRLTAQAGGE